MTRAPVSYTRSFLAASALALAVLPGIALAQPVIDPAPATATPTVAAKTDTMKADTMKTAPARKVSLHSVKHPAKATLHKTSLKHRKAAPLGGETARKL